MVTELGVKLRTVALTFVLFATSLVAVGVEAAINAQEADAGVYFNDTEFTYKEYWADHSTYTAGCDENEVAGNSFYIEPEEGCLKEIDLQIQDDVSGAIAAVVYVDLWRNRLSRSARFTINDGPQYRPSIGTNFSRTPFTATVPLTQLEQGANSLKFQEAGGAYHVHDVMIRVYYDDQNPIIPGPNSDASASTGSLTSIQAEGGPVYAPGDGGVLQVDGNRVFLTADAAAGTAYVEFHAYYDGYDEDNDGETRDWHNFLRNNFGPGGTEEKANGATIGHIGTDSTAPYEATWNLPEVANQSGVRFKIRVVDFAGNVVEAAGGVSEEFTLERTYEVETYTIANFPDQGLYFDGEFPQIASLDIDLPTNLANVDRAIVLGNYWNTPDLSINDQPPFAVFQGPEDDWDTSKREIDPAMLRPGSNSLKWNYRPPGFGAMVEGPGPMIVIHRSAPSGAPVITSQPADVLISAGQAATLTVTATGEETLSYQWLLDGNPVVGATSASYTTSALLAANDGSTYSAVVTNAQGTATSQEATVRIAAPIDAAAPWWDTQWDYRAPLTAFPASVDRTNKIIEQTLDFSALMAAAGSGGPTFDPNSIRVVEVDSNGTVTDAAVPFQFEPANNYDAISNAVGRVVWQLTGSTPTGQARYYHVYFDKTVKGIPAAVVAPQLTRTDVVDEGFAAYRFDLADSSSWFFHLVGGGFSKIIDSDANDWISWNTDPGSAGDFRGLPNAVKPPNEYFHPGRLRRTNTTVLFEGPLRIVFESRARDNSWISVWSMYPDSAEFAMNRANSRFWAQYEGTPGGEVDPGDTVTRSDGTVLAIDDEYEADIPGDEWMYISDPADNRSFYLAHHQDDGAVESYRLLDGQLPILAFGRGGLGLNSPYLRRVIDGEPQTFTFGLADSVDVPTTSARILDAYKEVDISVGASEFNGTDTGARSDDFSSPTIDPMWTVSDFYENTADAVTFGVTGSSLLFDIPEGVSHDMWEGRDFAPRIMQPIGDDDLDIVAGFLSSPRERFQGQGLLFQQDADNWIRFSGEHDGNRAKVVAYQMVDGVASTVIRKNLPGVVPRYLRAVRSGDTWSFQRSYNGSRWFSLNDVTVPINLTQVGVVVNTHSNDSTSPAYIAELDYFESKTSGPLNDDAPQISNVNVVTESRKAVVTWETNVPADSRLDHGPTSDISQRIVIPDLVTEHSVTIDYLRCGTPYFVRPQSRSEVGTTIDDVVTFNTSACQTIVSDDFSGGTLAPFWELFDPVGDVGLTMSSSNAVLSVPAVSEHNLFAGENQAARLRQQGPVGDFGVEAKFESVLNKRFQTQGVVIEEDDDTFLRFEVNHDGTETRAFAIAIVDDVPSTTAIHSGPLPTSVEHYVRVTRVGNTWTMFHSTDGETFNQVTSFVSDVASNYVGPYIGNTATGNGVPPAVLGSIDYFFNTASPIVPEDGGAGPDVTAPAVSNVVVQNGVPNAQSATITWDTDEPSTTRADWGLTPGYGDGPLVDNVATNTHVAVVEPVICGTTYHFAVSSNDASGNTGAAPDATFTTAACPTGPFSDNFDGNTLDARWFVDDPRQDSNVLLDGDLLTLAVPAGIRHDLTPNNNGALRVLQAASDTDFEVHAGFESPVDFNFQLQGILFEADDDNLIRFDLSNDGTGTKALVGILAPSGLDVKTYTAVTGAAPSRLRVIRTGSTWQFDYSSDPPQVAAPTWINIWTGTIDFTVARMGPFAGNANPQVANVPPHSALVDYFWTTNDPIAITGTGNTEAPQFTIFDGTGGVWDGTTPLEFGTIGMAQPDINIRGRVTDPDGIRSLTYSVAGSEPTAMGIGSTDCEAGVSCTRRLALDGDLNADVDSSLLSDGLNTVTLRAVDEAFNESVVQVLVNYSSGNTWPIPYTVDWSGVTDLNTVGQPIDGRWSSTGDTLHIDEIGYDRLIAFGDGSWSSFEAEVPITINSFDPEGYEAPSGGPGVGFIPHWRGHTQAEFTQPKYGFSGQVGGLVWYRYRDDINAERLEIRDSNAALVAEDLSGRTLTPGRTYIFKIQAETGGGDGPLYRLKVWEQGTSEPGGWDIVTALPPDAPDTGSLALVAHHVDANFGDLQVREIVASEPDISPTAGTYPGLAKIEMSTSTRAGEIRYTLDGTEPTESSPLFDEPFFINEGATVKARTFRSGFIASPVAERSYTITPAPDRVTDGLQLLYRFDEDAGTSVFDTSLTGTALNLDIEAGSDVTWLPDVDALRVNGPSFINSVGGAAKLNNGVKASNAVTVEMWVDPATFDTGSAALFNIAPGGTPDVQNLEVAQEGRSVEVSLRSTVSDSDGKFSQNSGSIMPPQLHHLVYVRRPNNTVQIYIDGALAWEGFRGGNLSAWASGYGLSLANSAEGINPWTGDIYLAAAYSDDLTTEQINQNYRSGPFPPPANFSPVVSAGSDITIVEGETATMAATATDDGNPDPPGSLTTTWTQISGPGTAVFSDSTSGTASVTLPAAGTYGFEWRADDGEKSTIDVVQVDVIPGGSQAPAPTITPPTGNYPGEVTVTIENTVPNAEVRFTLDGSDPTATSSLYSDPFLVSTYTVVKARTFRSGLLDSDVETSTINITPDSRVEDDLVALYSFNEASGATIKDRTSSPLNLNIKNVGRTTRVPSGVRIDQSTVINTAGGANKINNGVRSSNEITVEMWLEPADIAQTDAMLFGLSANNNARNIGMFQNGVDLSSYLRSTATNTKGEPPTTATGALQQAMMHVVFTRDAAGVSKLFIDGNEVAADTVGGDLGNWISSHRLHLGAERDLSGSWLGTYYMLAVYDRALTQNEVVQNFAFGDV